MTSIQATFLGLVLAQTAHSVEEYLGQLWTSFPPAAFLTGLISSDRELGFLILNTVLVLFGFWCVLVPVRRGWRSASAVMWFWVVLETINGVGHPFWSATQRAYTPGVLTAPLLLGLASYLALLLRRTASRASTA